MDRDGAEIVGSLHYDAFGAHMSSRGPQVLETWLVTLRDATLASRVVDLLGGATSRCQDNGHARYVITETRELDVLLGGPEDLNVGWHRHPGHVCDGASQHDQRGSRSCACPTQLAYRKLATRAGRGCRPRIWLCFRLLQDPALGMLSFSSGNWAFAEQASEALASLRRDPRLAYARLGLHRTPHRLGSGTTITYTRPALTLVRAGSLEVISAIRR
jgi:hypothetical protein